jgi:hypothetical protein
MKFHEMRSLIPQRPAMGVSFQKRNVTRSNAEEAGKQGHPEDDTDRLKSLILQRIWKLSCGKVSDLSDV